MAIHFCCWDLHFSLWVTDETKVFFVRPLSCRVQAIMMCPFPKSTWNPLAKGNKIGPGLRAGTDSIRTSPNQGHPLDRFYSEAKLQVSQYEQEAEWLDFHRMMVQPLSDAMNSVAIPPQFIASLRGWTPIAWRSSPAVQLPVHIVTPGGSLLSRSGVLSFFSGQAHAELRKICDNRARRVQQCLILLSHPSLHVVVT